MNASQFGNIFLRDKIQNENFDISTGQSLDKKKYPKSRY